MYHILNTPLSSNSRIPTKVLLTSFLALHFFFTSCHTQPIPPPGGVVAMAPEWKPVMYLIQPGQFGDICASYSGKVVDSAHIEADGRFVFSRVQLPAQPGLYQICCQRSGSRYPQKFEDDNPLLANYMPVVLQQGQPFQCQADISRLQASFSLENPISDNATLLQLRDLRHAAFLRDSLWLSPNAHPDEENLLSHEAAILRFQTPLIQFADSTQSFWAAITAARWVSPAGDYERVPEFLFQCCEKWRAKRPGDSWTAQLCKAGSRDRLPVLIGDPLPDFPLPMSTGDTMALRSLLGSKLTIVDIWASWCMPCRRENREVLVPLWARFRDRGLQIVGYSIDSAPAAWKAAIAKDGATWPHASHLSGDETPYMNALRLRTIPANFLLDNQGNIIAKNLHGTALTEFVNRYFQP